MRCEGQVRNEDASPRKNERLHWFLGSTTVHFFNYTSQLPLIRKPCFRKADVDVDYSCFKTPCKVLKEGGGVS